MINVGSVLHRFEGEWKCDDSALSALQSIIEQRIHSVLHRAVLIAQHCNHLELKRVHVELALYLSGHWTSSRAPAIVESLPMMSADNVDIGSDLLTKDSLEDKETKTDMDRAEHKTDGADLKVQFKETKAPFDERLRRFGMFYRSQFPDELAFTDADYDEAGENVALRIQAEKASKNHYWKVMRCVCHLNHFLSCRATSGSFGWCAVMRVCANLLRSSEWLVLSMIICILTQQSLLPLFELFSIHRIRLDMR